MMARVGRFAAAALVVVSLTSGTAHAGFATLKRAVENATQGPFDGALVPIVAGQTTYRNVAADHSSVGGSIGKGVITYGGLMMFGGAASFFRTLAGLVELPLGLGLAAATPFTSWEPPAFFDVSRSEALVDRPGRVFNLKVGVHHVGERD